MECEYNCGLSNIINIFPLLYICIYIIIKIISLLNKHILFNIQALILRIHKQFENKKKSIMN